jgi:hypothetical protein
MRVCLITGELPLVQRRVGNFAHKLSKAQAELRVEASIVTLACIATYRQVLPSGLQHWRMK